MPVLGRDLIVNYWHSKESSDCLTPIFGYMLPHEHRLHGPGIVWRLPTLFHNAILLLWLQKTSRRQSFVFPQTVQVRMGHIELWEVPPAWRHTPHLESSSQRGITSRKPEVGSPVSLSVNWKANCWRNTWSLKLAAWSTPRKMQNCTFWLDGCWYCSGWTGRNRLGPVHRVWRAASRTGLGFSA